MRRVAVLICVNRGREAAARPARGIQSLGDPGSRNFTSELTVLFDRQPSAAWDAFIEYAADLPQHGCSRQLLHDGTAYKLAPHHQLDFHPGTGLTRATPRSYLGIRYCWLGLTRQTRGDPRMAPS